MLPNLKAEAQALKKILETEFDLKILSQECHDIVARMKTGDDIRDFRKQLSTLSNQIFGSNIVHICNSAGEVAGEDEMCCFLQRILRLKHGHFKNIFSVEARGYYSTLGNVNVPRCAIIQAEPYDDNDVIDDTKPFLHIHHGLPLSKLNAFDEVFVADTYRTDEASINILKWYVENIKFKTGLVAASTNFGLATMFHSQTKFSVMYHLAVGSSYRSTAVQVSHAINSIRRDHPDAIILCWLSTTHRGGNARQAVFKEASFTHKIEVEGVGYVEDENHRKFFSSVTTILQEMQVPMIQVPYLDSLNIFANSEKRVTTKMIRICNDATREIVAQLNSLGFPAECEL
ncbi:hypothetical protein ACO0LD_09125 [Undibacterium sp. Ji83W]|uniref:hypothetical protein n=1 Tax=Undibacterium sp. Ji83W TaxID=3413043 RepID=UPI003BF164D2